MTLITRQGKGSKLTISEMDDNLIYLAGSYKKTTSSNIDWSEATTQEYTLEEDVTFTFTGAQAGQKLKLILDQQTNPSITWPESVKWAKGITPEFNFELQLSNIFGDGFNNYVSVIVLQSDGKILVGGAFDGYDSIEDAYGGQSTGYCIARLNADGTLDETFDTVGGFNDYVETIAVQSDGKILVGGFFNQHNNQSIGLGIVRLNVDGSLDETFITGTGFNSVTWSIDVQSDGKILISGDFDEYNGQSIGYGIARLNQDGSLDETFVTGVGFDYYEESRINRIALQSDGKVICGGYFDSYAGQSTGFGIARLNQNGSLDETFITGSGFNFSGDIETIAVQSDGKILLGGGFSSYDGQEVGYGIIRLNQNGSLDETFVTGTGFNDFIRTIAIQSNGKILVGGEFDVYNEQSIGYGIVRLNKDGSLDETFSTGSGFNENVNTITIQSDGKIFVGGLFDQFNFQNIALGIARINQNTGYQFFDFYFNGEYYIGVSTINQNLIQLL